MTVRVNLLFQKIFTGLKLLSCLITVVFSLSMVNAEGQIKGNDSGITFLPVITLDFHFPTADKPQSKLWYADHSWWAILPDVTGPTLWKRAETGWSEIPQVREKLKGVPGRADVWAEETRVTAVGVDDSSLTVFRLEKLPGNESQHWNTRILAVLLPPVAGTIETATIGREESGLWWVAATSGASVCVWHSADNGHIWGKPYILASGIDADDICVVTPLAEGTGVIWSDQVRDAVVMRVHRNGNAPGSWDKEILVDSGNKTADDHLNTVLATDGTLWLTTKNSVDKAGEAQFVLRKRSPEGKWINKPYLILANRMKRPSRPIVVATADNKHVFVGHGDNDRSLPSPYKAEIVFAEVVIKLDQVTGCFQPVIVPADSLDSFVQNVTGPKLPFPVDAPWIVLASDTEGRVYEADLRMLIRKN